jgi:hypothetical protein
MPPVYEALLLNTVVPQIQAAQAGDSYVMVVNATTPALRITQTGTGDSILVEDAANPDSTPFVVTAAGDVGVGLSSPTVKLDVVGVIKATSVGASVIAVEGGAQLYAAVQMQATSSGGKNWSVISNATGSPLGAAGSLSFRDSSVGTTHMTLDASGNLGLGVTPSAWVDRTALEGSYGGALSFDKVYLQTALSSNCNYNGTNWLYKLSGWGATRYELGDISNGSAFHKWYTAPSGTANDPVSFTQAMTLDASGNLGVGTTSPGCRLDVTAARATSRLTSSTGTNAVDFQANNTGGQLLLGIDNSAGSSLFGAGGYTAGLWYSGAYPLAFGTNNTERARITSGGYFKASNAGTYQNAAGAYHELRQTASDWIGYFVNTNATPYGIQFGHITDANSTGSPFFQCTAGAALGTLRAEIRSNGGLANYQSNNVDLSDARTKTDINPLGSYWSKIAGLEIVSYKYKDQTHDDLNVGVIAQQVEAVAPEFVDTDGFGDTPEDGVPLKTIYNKDLTFAAIKALQEAMARIETLEAKIAALEAK